MQMCITAYKLILRLFILLLFLCFDKLIQSERRSTYSTMLWKEVSDVKVKDTVKCVGSLRGL